MVLNPLPNLDACLQHYKRIIFMIDQQGWIKP